MEKKDLKKYVNAILTAHIVKRPSDHEAGLALLLRLKGEFCPINYTLDYLIVVSQRPNQTWSKTL